MVERILPFQGSAKCSRHNYVFLEGVKSTLMADSAFNEGFYREPPQKGLRAAARVYAYHKSSIAEKRISMKWGMLQ